MKEMIFNIIFASVAVILAVQAIYLFFGNISLKNELRKKNKEFENKTKAKDEQNAENIKAKESMETGSSTDDFNASVSVLQKLKKHSDGKHS